MARRVPGGVITGGSALRGGTRSPSGRHLVRAAGCSACTTASTSWGRLSRRSPGDGRGARSRQRHASQPPLGRGALGARAAASGVPDVTVVRPAPRPTDVASIAWRLDPRDATRHHGVPVTSPARTLLDLAVHSTREELGRAVEEAQVHRLVTDASLTEQFKRYPTHRGGRALKKTIQTEPSLTRSEAERRLLELIRAARLPAPRTNVRMGRYEVDFLWPEHDLIVEVDGYAFHSSRIRVRARSPARRRARRHGSIGWCG